VQGSGLRVHVFSSGFRGWEVGVEVECEIPGNVLRQLLPTTTPTSSAHRITLSPPLSPSLPPSLPPSISSPPPLPSTSGVWGGGRPGVPSRAARRLLSRAHSFALSRTPFHSPTHSRVLPRCLSLPRTLSLSLFPTLTFLSISLCVSSSLALLLTHCVLLVHTKLISYTHFRWLFLASSPHTLSLALSRFIWSQSLPVQLRFPSYQQYLGRINLDSKSRAGQVVICNRAMTHGRRRRGSRCARGFRGKAGHALCQGVRG
jgi:hypothetical protein